MRVSTSIDIGATADEVWEVIGPGFARVSNWVSAIAASEATDEARPGATGPGETGLGAAPSSGRACSVASLGFDRITEELTAYDPAARRLSYHVARGMPAFVIEASNTWQARALPDGRTKFTMDAQVELAGIGRLVAPFLRVYLSRIGTRTSRDLKAYIETGTPSRAKAIQSHASRRTALDRILLLNAAFSAASGATLAAANSWWSDQLANPGATVTATVGVALVGYGVLLAWASGRGITAQAGRIVAALDTGWVLGTMGVLSLFGSVFTPAGLAAATLSGLAVGALGWFQWRAAGSIDKTSPTTRAPLIGATTHRAAMTVR
jgi:hypothetical protein